MLIVFKKIELSDKELFDSYYKNGYYMGSEACFSNNYAWHQGYNIEFDIINEFLCIRGKHGNKPPYYFMPFGNGDKKNTVKILFDIAKENGEKLILKQLSSENAKYIEQEFNGLFKIINNRNSAEYIYKTEDLINLSGKKLHAKKNHLNKFLKSYSFEYEDLTPFACDEALGFVLNQLEEREKTQDEEQSLNILFKNFETLKLVGGIIRIDNKIQAVSLGEMLNSDTAVIHVEKANTEYNGSFAAINQMFVCNNFENARYINREEDMGIDGLRRSKLSYNPELLLKKFEAWEI